MEQKPQEEDASILKFPKGLTILFFFYFLIIRCPNRNFSTILKFIGKNIQLILLLPYCWLKIKREILSNKFWQIKFEQGKRALLSRNISSKKFIKSYFHDVFGKRHEKNKFCVSIHCLKRGIILLLFYIWISKCSN